MKAVSSGAAKSRGANEPPAALAIACRALRAERLSATVMRPLDEGAPCQGVQGGAPRVRHSRLRGEMCYALERGEFPNAQALQARNVRATAVLIKRVSMPACASTLRHACNKSHVDFCQARGFG